MKTLATCTPTEFLKQTNRIRKAVEKWLTDTDIINIRKSLPKLETMPEDADVETRNKVFEENQKRSRDQARKNLSRILDALCEGYPEETLEVLALVCFVEPSEVDTHTMEEYITAITDLISNQAVVGFFTSLTRWGVSGISSASSL